MPHSDGSGGSRRSGRLPDARGGTRVATAAAVGGARSRSRAQAGAVATVVSVRRHSQSMSRQSKPAGAAEAALVGPPREGRRAATRKAATRSRSPLPLANGQVTNSERVRCREAVSDPAISTALAEAHGS